MSDALHHGAAGALDQLSQQCLARGTLGAAYANLDQFMILQGTHRFGADSIREAGLADEYQRLERVCFATQEAQLVVGEFHLAIME